MEEDPPCIFPAMDPETGHWWHTLPHPLGPKYDLVYRDQEWVQLVHRYVIQYTRASGDKVWLAHGSGCWVRWCL